MKKPTPQAQTKLSKETLLAIHHACSRFEEAWPTPQRITIEEIVNGLDQDLRESYVESLIRSEMELRSLSFQDANAEEFLRRFPDHPNAVSRAWLSAEELSQLDRQSTPGEEQRGETKSDLPGHDGLHGRETHSLFDIPQRLGQYEIVEEHARGGMGIVFRARDQRLDRPVALKVVRSGQLASDMEIARFQTETQAIASLDHPNIVPVFEVGESAGFHYFSMPLIEGGNLADRIREQPMNSLDAARITLLIAEAVHYAHQRGVIHRDLKPRNILFDASGSPRVTDFGLAKFIANEQEKDRTELDLTMTNQAIGTPAYMAPEQAQGKSTKLSDVYSLGAILYALITGRPPFQAPSTLELLRQVIEVEPVEPRRLNPMISRDLETITMKCLNKTEQGRYGSAKLLAEDLDRFLDGTPILARPISRGGRLWRWIKRQPLVAGSIATVWITLATGLGVSIYFYLQAREQEVLTKKNLDVATAAVKQFLSEVASSPELKEKGLEILRRDLLQSAQGFFLQLEKEPNAPFLGNEISDTQYQLAFISRELGEFEQADKLYRAMIAELDARRERMPGDEPLNRLKASALVERAKIASEGKEDLLQQAVALRRDLYLKSQTPSDSIWLGSALSELGVHLSTLDRAEDESKIFGEIEKICERRVDNPQESLKIDEKLELQQVIDQLALNRQRHGQLESAEKWFLAEEKLVDQLMTQVAKGPAIAARKAKVLRNLAMVFTLQNQHDVAVLYFINADKEYQRLIEQHPLVLDYADGRAVTLFNQGTMESMQRHWNEADSLIQQALVIQQKLVAKQPDHLNYRIALTYFYRTLATIKTNLGEIEKAIEYHQLGIQEQEAALKLSPDDQNMAFIASVQKGSLAEIYRSQNQLTQAASTYESSIEELRKLIQKNRSVVNHLRTVGMQLHSLAMLQTRLKEFEKAKVNALESQRWFEEVLEKTPESVDIKMLLANTHSGLAWISLELREIQEAEKEIQKSSDRLDGIRDAKKDEMLYRSAIGYSSYIRGRIRYANRDIQGSYESFTQAIENYLVEWKRVSSLDRRATVRIRELLSDAYRERAKALYRLGKKSEALEDCEAGLQLESGEHANELRNVQKLIQAN